MSDDQTTDTIAAPAATPDGWQWALVEIFGHRTHFGRVREIEIFGVKMLRVEVPRCAIVDGVLTAVGWGTTVYAGGAIFSLTETDETTVLQRNRWSYPTALAAPTGEAEDADDGGDGDGEDEPC